jgi:hypothetical protein
VYMCVGGGHIYVCMYVCVYYGIGIVAYNFQLKHSVKYIIFVSRVRCIKWKAVIEINQVLCEEMAVISDWSNIRNSFTGNNYSVLRNLDSTISNLSSVPPAAFTIMNSRRKYRQTLHTYIYIYFCTLYIYIHICIVCVCVCVCP